MRRAGTAPLSLFLPLSVLALLSLSCENGAGSPTSAALTSCQLNQTADLAFANTSSGETMNVVVNGILRATLAPGQSRKETFAAATYTIQFINRYTGAPSCKEGSWTLAVCSSQTLSCKGGAGGPGGQGGGSGSTGSESQCHQAGMGYCSYGAGGFCAPWGTICCGYRNICPLFNGVIYGAAWNCQHGPTAQWACYPRDALNAYIHDAACLNAKSYQCDQRPR